MSTEFGIWSDEAGGFVETGFWSLETAAADLPRYLADDATARIREICSDHEEQPADACEDCNEPLCGETYDHTLKLIDSRDGSSTYECTECGAEIHEDDEEN